MPFRTAAALGMVLALPVAAQEAAVPGPEPTPTGSGNVMTADLASADGTSHGTATFTPTPSGVMMMTLDLKGLPAGTHAIHVHQTGECAAPDFKSAGGHLSGEKQHGVLAENGPHPGDMPNLHVPEGGAMVVENFKTDLTPEQMQDGDGSAVIIHSAADDYKGQPAGNAGGRLACGVLATAR